MAVERIFITDPNVIGGVKTFSSTDPTLSTDSFETAIKFLRKTMQASAVTSKFPDWRPPADAPAPSPNPLFGSW